MEYIDVVDNKNNIIDTASKDDIYTKQLTHRIIHVFVFNNEGKIALNLRAKDLPFCADHWCTAVAGHVSAGETPELAAMRESEEEIGITPKSLEFLYEDFYTDTSGPDKFLHTYKYISEGPFHPNPREVQRVEYFTIDQIRNMIAAGEKFHPELLYLLNKYYLDT